MARRARRIREAGRALGRRSGRDQSTRVSPWMTASDARARCPNGELGQRLGEACAAARREVSTGTN